MHLHAGPMVHGGACLGRRLGEDAGPAVLVDGAIPGEVVVAEVTGRRAGVPRARTVEVVEPSPDRVAAPCPYYGVCGGCDLQHVAYPRQLELKRAVVVDAMRRAGVALPAGGVPVHGMRDPWRYRWRGEFHVVRERPDGRVTGDAGPGRVLGLGFNRARSWIPVAVDDCLIHHEAIAGSLADLVDLVRESGTDDCT
ncbi:MAG TPA: hypothetical protein VFO60_12380, partial [Candidatus Dormibacteraeota bacterium]|nr:hypothetical protein [Candidatus Dormibacteraeota bacterium]